MIEFLRLLSIKRNRHRNIFAKKNHDRKVSRAISLATLRTKKFHQRFIELKPSTLRTSDEISSFAQYQEKSSPGKIFFTKILLNFLLWHSCLLLTFAWQNKRGFWSRIWNIRVEIRKNTFISRLLYFILITIHGFILYMTKNAMSLPVYHWVYFSLLCVYNVFLRCFIDLFMIVNDLLLMLPT